MKKSLGVISSILFLTVGAGFVLSYEFYLKDKVNTVDVVVASENISFKDEITQNSFEVASIRKDHVVEGAILASDAQVVQGQQASIDIPKGAQFYQGFLDTYNLIPNEEEGEFIAPVPNQWLFAVPGSLRRSYLADFYVVPTEIQDELQPIVISSNNSDEEPSETNESSDRMVRDLLQDPILTDVRVASVTDNSNREVLQAQDGVTEGATGVISHLEIVGTDEMLQTMRTYTDRGDKIYVVYKYGR
ncbi:flagellar biosynthesis protein FlgA (plasmid) [Alkalihalophilus sp. As8PL]|uniref:Flagellar biosynthesis protein FlgA n=1 Tax=Alkalihalophilus sp. As8PL TaxID=3237103 RepID=A0AB39BNP3_9BACI